MYYDTLNTPIGSLLLAVDADGALIRVGLPGSSKPGAPPTHWRHAPERLTTARARFAAYFDGSSRHVDLPLRPAGTNFQREVWQALCAIPYGETASYADIARAIGRPRAVRAVGAANGANPLAVVVPCHRVIGADGSLTGYGGGLPAKRWLLAHEARQAGLVLA